MDALQARLRDKASEMLQATPTMQVALGRGPTFTIETCYFVGTSDDIFCIVKPNPALVEAVRNDAQVAFAVQQSFPNHLLQGTGRGFFLGGLDRHPHIREQVLAKIPEAAPFLTTIRNLGVLRILPDQIAVTDDGNLGLGPRPVYLPEAARALPDRRSRWLQAMGMAWWPLALIPVLVAALLARHAPGGLTGWLLVPVLGAALLFLAGTILLATYADVQRQRIARPSSRVLSEGLLPAHQVFWAGLLCVAIAVILGLFPVVLRGAPMVLLGLVGGLAGLLCAGWPVRLPYRVLDDAMVFLGLGPLSVLAAYYALTGELHRTPLLASIPLGFLAAAVLAAGHLQSFADDTKAGIRTAAVVVGWARARLLYGCLLGLPYVLAAAFALAGALPGWVWLVVLSAPLAGRAGLTAWHATPEQAADLARLAEQTAYVYLAFGALFTMGLGVGSGGG